MNAWHLSLQVLKDHSGWPSTAVADTGDSVLASLVLKSSQVTHYDSGTAHTDGVTHGHGSSVDVALWVRDVQEFHVGEGDHWEGFVELEKVDVGEVEAGFCQDFFGSVVRGDRKINGFDLSIGVADDSSEGLQAEAVHFLLRHQN